MKVFIVNCGSSSIKYQLVDMETENVLAKGLVERIGLPGAVLTHTPVGRDKVVTETEIPDHSTGIGMVLNALIDAEHGVISSLRDIDAVGHRVAHGGERFTDSVLITADVVKGIEACVDMAPLHNPAALLGIKACKTLIEHAPQVAVFDTAFHQTMPKQAYLYGLPYELYEKYGVRRYGFHGTSHKYVAQRAAEMMGKHMTDLRIVTCHLGNGASVTAVKNGKSIDTSMGFTPLAGLVMGTRSGEIDPAIIPFLMVKENMTIQEVDDYLNKKSGVLGISGLSSDFRDLEEAAHKGEERSQLAIDIFAYRVKKFIGSYVAAMGGVDAISFAGGIGENSALVRKKALEGLEFMGIALDQNKNETAKPDCELTGSGSRARIFAIATNEEIVVARKAKSYLLTHAR